MKATIIIITIIIIAIIIIILPVSRSIPPGVSQHHDLNWNKLLLIIYNNNNKIRTVT